MSDKTIAQPSEGTSPQNVIRVSNFLSDKKIAIFPAGPSKQQVIGNLIGCLDLADPSQALKAILAREEAGSTVIAPGIALPHARIPGLSGIAASLGICPTGVVDPSSRGSDPIRLFILFVGPSENMREHLAFLASVSSLFQVDGLSEALFQMTTPQAVLEKIQETEKNFA